MGNGAAPYYYDHALRRHDHSKPDASWCYCFFHPQRYRHHVQHLPWQYPDSLQQRHSGHIFLKHIFVDLHAQHSVACDYVRVLDDGRLPRRAGEFLLFALLSLIILDFFVCDEYLLDNALLQNDEQL